MHSNNPNLLTAKNFGLLALSLFAGAILLFGPAGVGVITASADTTYLIHDNGTVRYYTTSATDPADVLDEAGLELGIDDTYTITESNGYPGIYIQRIQTITIDNGGQILRTGTYGETVGSLLESLNVTFDGDDTISEDLDAETYDGMQITISRKTYATESYSRTLAYSTRRVEDPSLPKGQEQILTAGRDGEVLCTAEVTYENGEEVNRRILSNRVTAAPVNQVVAVGTRTEEAPTGSFTVGDGVIITPEGDTLTYTHTMPMRATAYTHTDAGCNMTTATGTTVHVGTVAVDPRVIPYGTRMFIVTNDGQYIYGLGVAEDCGGAIQGDRLDLYFPTFEECVQFGWRNCTVYFLG